MAAHIGLIGGIGPAATDYYYRKIISKFGGLGEHLDLTVVHADSRTLLGNLEKDDPIAQVEIYSRLTDRLVAAGAELVVVTSIAGHFCIDSFAEVSPLPIINLIDVVDEVVGTRKLKSVGILGTRTVMESRFYSGLSSASVLIPPETMLQNVHDAYIAMAASGEASATERSVMDTACRWFFDQAGVDAILLGGTDLALVYDEATADFPVVDCAAIHAEAVVNKSAKN